MSKAVLGRPHGATAAAPVTWNDGFRDDDDDSDDGDGVAFDPEFDYEAVLVARVDACIAKAGGVIKAFLGGTLAAALPLNLYKLKFAGVRELLCDNSPRLRVLSQDIGALSATLTRLDCSNCALTAVPEELGTLQHLQFLNLSNNRLSAFVWECPGLGALVELDLSRNRIRYFSPQVADRILARAQPDLSALGGGMGGGLDVVTATRNATGAQRKQQEMNQQALVAARRIFIDLAGNERYFVAPSSRDRAHQLHALVPEAASTTCAICGVASYTRMPHIAARFMHIGAPSPDYAAAKMTRTTPVVKFICCLYPCCGADCAMALSQAEAWMRSLSQL